MDLETDFGKLARDKLGRPMLLEAKPGVGMQVAVPLGEFVVECPACQSTLSAIGVMMLVYRLTEKTGFESRGYRHHDFPIGLDHCVRSSSLFGYTVERWLGSISSH